MALYQSKYYNYKINSSIDDSVQQDTIKFQEGTFQTDSPNIIQFLKDHPSRGVHFFRIDTDKQEEDEMDKEWKERVREYDDLSTWGAQTVEAFKMEEPIHRCQYECGFATKNRGGMANHERHCSENPENKNAEGAAAG